VRLAPGAGVGEHVEDDLDVLLVVVEGGGHIDSAGGGRLPLHPHALVWLPRSSRRSVQAGPEGLAYLTVHQRRPGLTVRNPAGRSTRTLAAPAVEGGEGGEAPCLLTLVCDACGRISPERSARYCGQCGEALHSNG
jgi:hypothetical protein